MTKVNHWILIASAIVISSIPLAQCNLEIEQDASTLALLTKHNITSLLSKASKKKGAIMQHNLKLSNAQAYYLKYREGSKLMSL